MRGRGVQPLGPHAGNSELVSEGHGRERGERETRDLKRDRGSTRDLVVTAVVFFLGVILDGSFVVPIVGSFGVGGRAFLSRQECGLSSWFAAYLVRWLERLRGCAEDANADV